MNTDMFTSCGNALSYDFCYQLYLCVKLWTLNVWCLSNFLLFSVGAYTISLGTYDQHFHCANVKECVSSCWLESIVLWKFKSVLISRDFMDWLLFEERFIWHYDILECGAIVNSLCSLYHPLPWLQSNPEICFDKYQNK